MKKVFTLSLLIMILFVSWTTQAQRAPLEDITRNLVVVEIGTGTWCGYCPGAAMGADDLVHNGHPVAIVENHNGDAYTNDYSNARNSFYAITGYPTTVFDGGDAVVGGSATNTMYGSFFPKVDARMTVQTPIELDFTFTDNGNNNYTVSADISKVGTYDSDLVMHLFVTESHIAENWGIMTDLNFVNRLMVPDQNGTALDFSGGNDLTKELTFDMDPSWVSDNCEFVIAIQDMSSKEILNGAKAFALQPTNDYDAAVTEIIAPADLACGEEVNSTIVLKNYGGEALTSLDIEYSINGGTASTYNWTGEIGFLLTAAVELPVIAAVLEAGENTIEVTISNPNGQPDADDSNNTTSHVFNALTTGVEVVMEAAIGTYGEELSWKLYAPSGTVVAEDTYTAANSGQTITETFTLTETGCHSLVWSDSYGDGFNGGGWCKIFSEDIEIYNFNSFGAEFALPWYTQIGDPLMGPVNPSATIVGYDIEFEWTAPGKATLLGYNIYESTDMANPINADVIVGETYSYSVDGNGQYAFYFTAVYEEGESAMVGPVEASITVGITEVSEKDMNFYPNPVSDILNITYQLESASDVKVNVYTISGREVMNMEYASNKSGSQEIKVDTRNFENGVYLVQLLINDQVITKKFSVSK